MEILDKRRLGVPLAEGGEGIVYKHDGKILKIFKSGVDLYQKEEKLKLLLKVKLPNNIIGPIDLVYSKSKQFIGYTMKEVKGDELRLLASKKFLKLSDLSKEQITKILLKVGETLTYLHKNKIYVGDLNDSGIILDSNWEPFFIDIDSWAINKYPCTVIMDTFKDPLLKGTDFNRDTDFFAYSVISFKGLTRMHPYGGTMNPDVPILERMTKGINVIDNDKVKIPRIIDGWRFLNPASLDAFKDIFSHQNRDGERLIQNLNTFTKNLKECKTHGQYYDEFNNCPVCDETAEIKLKPVQLPGGDLPMTVIFDGADVKIILDEFTYLSNQNKICNLDGFSQVASVRGTVDKYNESGMGVVSYYDDRVSFKWKESLHTNQSFTTAFVKHPKFPVLIERNKIYFVDHSLALIKMDISKKGNYPSLITTLSINSVFEVYKKHFFVCMTDYKRIIHIDGRNIELESNIPFKHYGIHFDKLKNRWLFVHDSKAGDFYTYIFDDKGILYETTDLNYDVDLANLAYFNNTIFRAGDGVIRGYNWRKKSYKDFNCPGVEADANLIYTGSKIKVLNEKEILLLG